MTSTTPELIPLLSRGKHRNPRKGACFMEMASFLAGERWSDHPNCTHPLLGSAARLVNDCTPDGDRQELAHLIPSVVGLASDDPRWDAVIARRAAATAVPIVAEHHQRALAVGLVVCERILADLDGRPSDDRQEIAREALRAAPLAARWADDFASGHHVSLSHFRRRSAPNIVQGAVLGIAEACISDPPGELRRLLAAIIADCRALSVRPEAERSAEIVSSGTSNPAGEPHGAASDGGRLPLRRDVPVGVPGVEVDS